MHKNYWCVLARQKEAKEASGDSKLLTRDDHSPWRADSNQLTHALDYVEPGVGEAKSEVEIEVELDVELDEC